MASWIRRLLKKRTDRKFWKAVFREAKLEARFKNFIWIDGVKHKMICRCTVNGERDWIAYAQQ